MYNKYIKYKKKYLNLKKLIGGEISKDSFTKKIFKFDKYQLKGMEDPKHIKINTDGTIEPSDVYRIAGNGSNQTNINVKTDSFEKVFEEELNDASKDARHFAVGPCRLIAPRTTKMIEDTRFLDRSC